MERNTERILRSNDVEISGRVQLAGIASAPNGANRQTIPSVSANAAIVENTPDFAIIEVVCPCGRKTSVKCEYVAAE